jgi:hypothetical protein
MGFVLLLTGIGFLVLTLGLLSGEPAMLRHRRHGGGSAPTAPAAG